MTYFHRDEAKKKYFFEKKFKMADAKKLSFSTSPKAEQFPPKFHGLMWRNLYGHEALRQNVNKKQKMHFLCF